MPVSSIINKTVYNLGVNLILFNNKNVITYIVLCQKHTFNKYFRSPKVVQTRKQKVHCT